MSLNWQTLLEKDRGLAQITNSQSLISNGMAPLLADHHSDIAIKKTNLLEQHKYHNWQSKAQQLCKAFEQKNVRFLVLKGLAYSHLLYDNSHIRVYSDIDIFIDQADYNRVCEILKLLGYQPYPSRQGRFVSFQNSFFDDNVPQSVIDVHWQINNRIEFHRFFPFKELYSRAQVIEANDLVFKTLNAVESFILACFHYQAHRAEHRKHIWLYDMTLLWHKMSDTQQVQCLQMAQQTQQTTVVLSTLRLLDQTFDGCVDLKNTNDYNVLHQRASEATAQYLNNRNKKFTDIKIRLASIKGFNNKLIFIGEYLFQKKSYVQERYDLASQRWIYLYYPKMWLQDFLKLFK